MSTIVNEVYSTPNLIVSTLARLTYSPVQFSRPVFRMVLEDFFQGFEKNGKQVFREHYAQIRSLVPKERLLEFRVEEGWEPLCRFLEKPVPQGPFLKGNEKAVSFLLLLKHLSVWLEHGAHRTEKNSNAPAALITITTTTRVCTYI